MKYLASLFIPLLIVGCAQTTTQKITDLENGETLVLQAATTAEANGLITKADLQKAKPYADAVVSATIAAEAAYQTGDTANGDKLLANAQIAEAAFNAVLTSLEKPATTQPTVTP